MDQAQYDNLINLPPVIPYSEDDKLDFATEPDTSLLKEKQKIIFDEVMEMQSMKGSHIYVIKGYAGTGKSFLVTQLMEMILSTTNHKVAVTAPTNKAVKVLKSQSKFKSTMLNLRFSTIHSLLGLREQITPQGKQRFVKLRDEDAKVDQYSMIFLDEVSMFSDELFDQLIPYLQLYDIKLVFIGDPAQIPPVGYSECIPFTEEGVKEHNMKVGTLTEVLRQSADNPIIQTTMKIRKALHREDILPVRSDNYAESFDGVYYLQGSDKDYFYGLLNTYFTSDNFKNDADFVKIVAGTNRIVDIFNSKIRTMIYGKDAGKLCIGEKLIANRPIASPADENQFLFNNNDEFEVVSFEVIDGEYRKVPLRYYHCKVKDSNTGTEKTVKIIHEDSEEDYGIIKDHLADVAKAKKGWEAASAWKDFYRIQEVFADVKYNYAITAHKAQGSTYTNTFVMEEDINVFKNIEQRNRIKYTAFTRPSNKLFIVT